MLARAQMMCYTISEKKYVLAHLYALFAETLRKPAVLGLKRGRMIRFETTLDHQTADVLKDRTSKKVWPSIIVFSVLLGVFGLFLVLDNQMAGILILGFGILIPIGYRQALRTTRKKMNESFSLLSPMTHEVCTFDEEGVSIETTKGEEYSSAVKARWSYFWRVEETETHYLCYISAEQAHVMSKACITQGTTDDFNLLLTRMLGKKYIPFKPKYTSTERKK